MERYRDERFLPAAGVGVRMPRGILELIGLAGSVLFAASVGLFGVETLADGSTIPGLGYLVVAALMVLVPYYVTMPGDVAGSAVERTVDRVVESEDD
jgi:hypothetical protein